MKVGFTGTRKGMSKKQAFRLERLLYQVWEQDEDATHEFHNGACKGADSQAHNIVEVHSCYFDIKLFGHPNVEDRWRNDQLLFDKRYRRLSPLARNRNIVKASDIMFATPRTNQEELHGSGTWYTIRYAWELNRKLYIIWPDGQFDMTYLKCNDE